MRIWWKKKIGWAGLLQVLWERSFIEVKKLNLYSLIGRNSQMDDDGKLKQDSSKNSLHTLMLRCFNFTNKKSAMEYLFMRLSLMDSPNLSHPPNIITKWPVRTLNLCGGFSSVVSGVSFGEKKIQRKSSMIVWGSASKDVSKKQNVLRFWALCHCHITYEKDIIFF